MKIFQTYTSPEILQEINEFFEEEGFIQLVNFLDINIDGIKKEFEKVKFENIYIPDEKKLEILNEKELYNLEIIKLVEFFKSKEFLEYLEKITDFEIQFKSLKVKKYSHKDFTILHDNLKKEDLLEVYFDLTSNWKEEMGGTLTFTTREEEVFYLEPLCNALTILFKPEQVMKYLKYINNKAKENYILRIEAKYELIDE